MVDINKDLQKEFTMYCELNEITEVDNFIVKCAKDGLTLDKYGVAPFLPKSQIQEVPVEKEIVKEVIKEIPIEKEVIIEKIITKEVKDTQLIEELEKLRRELTEASQLIDEQKNKIKEQDDVLEHFKNVTVNRRAKYMKSSNLNDTYLD
jgi:vacuolar-type H+-ATPase subunit I/STV1